MKKRAAIFCVFCAIMLCLCACSNHTQSDEATPVEETSETTTKESTTAEDTDATFYEEETRKVYPGLNKGDPNEYPYKIATYTTYYKKSDRTRTNNLTTAASAINNIVVPQDGIFSFNQTVGKRTVTGGYSSAKVIVDDEFVDGLGGGVCQVSSTVFECVLRANAEIVERTNHSLAISYVPMGGDATVQWNTLDFKFKNTVGSDILLTMECNSGNLVCCVYAKDNINVGNVSVDIKKSGDKYTLTRYVNGKQNYKTVSKYREAKK